MIIPLRKVPPYDALPHSRATLAAGAVVANAAFGLSIPANQAIAAGAFYQSSTWIFTEGYDYFSVLGYVQTPAGSGIEVLAIPVSARDPSQQLDGISFGTMLETGYVRVSCEIPNCFGFHLRFAPTGGGAGTIVDFLELQLCKR